MKEPQWRTGRWVEAASGRGAHFRLLMPEEPKALVVFVHGAGEHGGRYEALAARVAGQGVAVAIPDLFGHGLSDGARGDLTDVAELADQLQGMTSHEFLPESKLARYAVFGHSMGGLVAIVWGMQAAGGATHAVIQSPWLGTKTNVPVWKTTAATLLAPVWPRFTFTMQIDAAALSRDAAVVQAYLNDPLVHNRITAQAYQAVLAAQRRVMAEAPSFPLPVTMLCGSADQLISVEAANQWFDRLRTEKSRHLFPDCYHELHHEPVQHEIANHIVAAALARG
jgi:alpha-beta hydrolase superfamily lysophospholipase